MRRRGWFIYLEGLSHDENVGILNVYALKTAQETFLAQILAKVRLEPK